MYRQQIELRVLRIIIIKHNNKIIKTQNSKTYTDWIAISALKAITKTKELLLVKLLNFMKLKAKLKIVKLTFSMKKIGRKVLKFNLRIKTLSRILVLHK